MSRSLSTAVNGSAGANSQVSGLVVAAMTVVTLLLLTGLFEKLPEATLAAVVIAAVIELVDFGSIARLYRVSTRRLRQGYGVAGRPDFIGAIAALLGVTVFDTLPGLFIGIAISMILLLYRASRPRIAELLKVPGTPDRYADAERLTGGERRPGVVILRVESGLFFANADWVRDHVRSATRRPGTTALVLDASNIAFIDVTAVEMLDQLADTLQYKGSRCASRVTSARCEISSERPGPPPALAGCSPPCRTRSTRWTRSGPAGRGPTTTRPPNRAASPRRGDAISPRPVAICCDSVVEL